ncbi:MAG TPA: hypothetical protein VG406_12930 [Isosphaeraceae bacterium]|jgi:hypothetical protein|nr:hypothetical protein [Isosphaeraceae bacterium]
MESTAVDKGAINERGRRGRRRIAAVTALVSATLAVVALSSLGPAPAPVEKVEYRRDTPEAAYHSFHVALVAGDAEALRKLALPLAEGDLAWLLNGEHLSRAGSARLHRAIGSKQELKRLRAGDVLTLPGGALFAIRPEQVGDDRAVLLPDDSPVPTDLRRVAGLWRVDARPIVAGRRAAAAKGRRP